MTEKPFIGSRTGVGSGTFDVRMTHGAAVVLIHILEVQARESSTDAYAKMLREWSSELRKVTQQELHL